VNGNKTLSLRRDAALFVFYGLHALPGREKSEGEATLFLFVARAGVAPASLAVKATGITAGVMRFLLKCILSDMLVLLLCELILASRD
jgi:hypothetical protein